MTSVRGWVTAGPVRYPEGDGKPMAETDDHRIVMMDSITVLSERYQDRPDVYVSGNLLLYYEEGNPKASISPDVLVAFGVAKAPHRRTYKVWEEGKAPDVVIEITSASSSREDRIRKRDLYAGLGVREHVLSDPLAEYLRPPLQGYRLEEDRYRPLPLSPAGAVRSALLGLDLVWQDGALRFYETATGAILLTPAERADREAIARRAAEQRAADLERELRELRARLPGGEPPGPRSDGME
ncbi:MAG: Uma2 family endonuclease [Dehalococcoidia bacterium]